MSSHSVDYTLNGKEYQPKAVAGDFHRYRIAQPGAEALRSSVTKLSDEALAELHEIFNHFDKNQNKKIESNELAALLDALGAEMSESEVATGLRALDEDGNGTIEFDEFAAWWADR